MFLFEFASTQRCPSEVLAAWLHSPQGGAYLLPAKLMRALFSASALVLAVLGSFTLPAHAADTAYTALQVMAKKLGEDSLSHVVEVQGRYGAPEPLIWKISLFYGGGSSAYREIEVQKGKIVADRKPSRGSAAPLLDFNRLNLDSEGVFTLVNQEAKKAKVPFDRVDYRLISGSRGAAPVWKVSLWDGQAGQVGRYDIAADNGDILNGGFETQRDRPLPPTAPPLTDNGRYEEEDRAYLDQPGERVYREEREERVERREYRPSGGNFGDRVERHFERRGRQIKKFFSGGYFH